MEQINYTKFILIFLGSAIGISVVYLFISFKLDLSASASAVIVPMLSAMISGQIFVKSYGRAPSANEAQNLTNYSFLSFISLHLLLIMLSLLSPGARGLFIEMNPAVMIFIVLFMAIVFLIAYFLIRWSYGGLTKKFADRLNK